MRHTKENVAARRQMTFMFEASLVCSGQWVKAMCSGFEVDWRALVLVLNLHVPSDVHSAECFSKA